MRVCIAAKADGLDISGTLFRIGGEPFTDARARIIRDAGARALSHYNMGEVGRLGVACTAPAALDDVHVVSDKVAFVQRGGRVGGGAERAGRLFCSTLHPTVPKLMLNVEIGDHGVLSERSCGCPLGKLGFRQHLHGIGSYEKVTSEGMQFVGSELLTLVDDVLPARFGGHPTDYQLVEEEEEGLSRVTLVVSPRVGGIDERRLVATVLEVLATPSGVESAGNRLMADHWRAAGTLRVVRRDPYSTAAGKILALHVVRTEGHGMRGITGAPCDPGAVSRTIDGGAGSQPWSGQGRDT